MKQKSPVASHGAFHLTAILGTSFLTVPSGAAETAKAFDAAHVAEAFTGFTPSSCAGLFEKFPSLNFTQNPLTLTRLRKALQSRFKVILVLYIYSNEC